MAQKMTGALVFDERTDRYDIRFDLNSYYGGLHCGECFDVSTTTATPLQNGTTGATCRRNTG